MKVYYRANHRWLGLVFVAIASTFLHLPVQAADFKNCKDCHTVVLEELFRTFLHVPFLQQRCEKCHAPEASPAAVEQEEPAKLEVRRKISWLGESAMADGNHGFVLPAEKVRGALLVEARGGGGGFSRKEISIPPLGGLADVKDNGKPPAISDVRVLRIERGVFLSAVIGWRTDTLTDAVVRYGNKDLSQASQPGTRLGRRHEVVLYNLKPDQIYRFAVVSRDLFGRSRESEPLTFSTSRPLTAPLPDQLYSPPEKVDDVGLTSRFQRIGADYLVELALEPPASVFIGTGETSPEPKPSAGTTGPTGGDDKHHADLTSMQVAALEACGGCHQKLVTASHPVNVYPKPGMVIPPEYPTLPDGRITCRSCHETHGSDHEYLTVKGGKRELCVGCHLDMI